MGLKEYDPGSPFPGVIGAQSFAELAVALTQGAAAKADLGVAMFVMPHGGLMAELSVGGQKLNFEPLGA